MGRSFDCFIMRLPQFSEIPAFTGTVAMTAIMIFELRVTRDDF